MTLKQQNYPFIILYVLFNFAIFFILYKNHVFSLNEFSTVFQKLSQRDGVFFILLPLLIIVAQDFAPSKIKEILVFWKKENRLPGCQAFSKYIKEDNRIDRDNLIQKYGNFPRSEDKQNRLWYKIYKGIKDKSIDKTHKDYLLLREFTVVTVLFIFILPSILFLFTNIDVNIILFYILGLIFEYNIVRIIAKNHAIRLVTNVLAFASVNNEK